MSAGVDVDAVAPHVSKSPQGAITLAELSRRLGVTPSKAERLLRDYLAEHGLALQHVRVRTGQRGRPGEAFYVVASSQSGGSEASYLSNLRRRVVAQLPDLFSSSGAASVPELVLVKQVGALLDGEVSENSILKVLAKLSSEDPPILTWVPKQRGYALLDISHIPTLAPTGRESQRASRSGAGVRGPVDEVTTPSSLRPKASAPKPVARARAESPTTIKIRGLDELFDESDDVRVGLPPNLGLSLSVDELFALRVLARIQSSRTTELAERLAKPAGRLGGMMRALKRKLHSLGHDLFSVEELGNGESMYRFTMKGSHEPRS